MPRKRHGAILLPWLSARPDGKEHRFIQVGNSLVMDQRFRSLTASAQMLYLCMCMESAGKQYVRFSRSIAAKYGFDKNTYSRRIKELRDTHFIDIDYAGTYYQFHPTQYRFSSAWKLGTPKVRLYPPPNRA